MMINPSELHSYSQRTLAEQHQQAAMEQLAQIATGQTKRADGSIQRRDRMRQLLYGLITRWRVARLNP